MRPPLTFASIVVTLCLLAHAVPQAQAEVASVFATTGTPKVKRATGGDEANLMPGNTLDGGDVVTTGEDSTAKLLLKDQSVIDVSPSTAFRVESLDEDTSDRQAALKADFGKVRASVNRKLSKKGSFLMRTPSTVMAVRGTEWVASSKPGTEKNRGKTKESVTVLAGRVEVRDVAGKEEPVVLERGKRLNIYLEFAAMKIAEVVRKVISGDKDKGKDAAAKRKHEVQTLDDAELAAQLRDARLEERTARQLLVLDNHGGGDLTHRQIRAHVPVPEAAAGGTGDIRTVAAQPLGTGPTWRR